MRLIECLSKGPLPTLESNRGMYDQETMVLELMLEYNYVVGGTRLSHAFLLKIEHLKHAYSLYMTDKYRVLNSMHEMYLELPYQIPGNG